MTLPKLLAIVSIFLFGLIGGIALFKEKRPALPASEPIEIPVEIEVDAVIHSPSMPLIPSSVVHPIQQEQETVAVADSAITPTYSSDSLPSTDRIQELFNIHDPKLPIVETLTYTSQVSWHKGRPAWLSDYASHYNTSRHFIARSLNGKPDYFTQDIAKGDRFNVFSNKINFEFYLLVDLSRCKVWFYYLDLDKKQKTLLKTYQVGLGRLDTSKASGSLTPFGKYQLGSRIIVYKPKMMGIYRQKKTEMITVFGTRWIPFEKEMGTCTLPAKGFGLHGTPWVLQANGELKDDTSSIGKYESDGCIRFATPDIEEIYAIIVTRPTTVEIVKDFHDSLLSTTYPSVKPN